MDSIHAATEPSPTSSSARFTGVLSFHVPELWLKILPLVESALEQGHGEYEAEDIYQALLSRDMQLWTDGCGIGVTEIVRYPQKSVCWVVLASGGPMADWLPQVSVIERWAKSKGCAEIRAIGRAGWARAMEKYGWQRPYALVRKEL
jgi:hypothetical protein